MRSLARSRQVAGTGFLGEYPPEAVEVIRYSWEGPFHISSNYARSHSIAVAFAASMGWISNIAPDGVTISRQWHPTAEGLFALRSEENTLQPEI